MRRRELLTTGTFAALTGGVATSAAAQGNSSSSSSSDRELDRIGDAIADLRDDLRAERQFREIAPIRTAQKAFLRANGKLPDFIELGADAWFSVYDWHVRWQQAPVEARDPQGRPTLTMNGTQVILRADVPGNFVGLAYDAR